MQATENGTLTKFIGGHYEETGSQITKHYFAGASRIATRKYTVPSSMSLEYVLSDHLGSSTVNTDGTTGAKVSEMRYKPWGEVRYSWKASASHSLADYTFTGQYSYMDDPSTSGVTEGFGLMYFGARWVDPQLGRFTQPDTIIPMNQGAQAWDRYAYTNNNPVKYTDPTGHWIETAFDVAMVAVDIADIASNGLSWSNGGALVADIASVIIPGIPAIGGVLLKAARAAKAADNVVDTAKAIDKVADSANAADDILAAASRLADIGTEADESTDLIRTITNAATQNPNANVVSLGSNGLYQKPGHTYFELPNNVWDALGPKGQEAINSQFMYDQMNAAKPFSFDFYDPTKIGAGSRLEIGILNDAVNAGIYQVKKLLNYEPIVPIR